MTDVFQPQPRQLRHEPPPLPGLRDGEDPVAHLRRCLEHATTVADDLATRGGKERGIAHQHLEAARRHDDEAVTARRRVEVWRQLLAAAEAEQGKDQAATAPPYPPLVARPTAPPAPATPPS